MRLSIRRASAALAIGSAVLSSSLARASGPGFVDLDLAVGPVIAISEPNSLALFAFGLGLIVVGHLGRRWRDKRRDAAAARRRHKGTVQAPAMQR